MDTEESCSTQQMSLETTSRRIFTNIFLVIYPTFVHNVPRLFRVQLKCQKRLKPPLPTMSVRATLQQLRPLRRSFHASAAAASHIGSTPVPIPAGVTFTYPVHSIDPSTSRALEAGQRFIGIKGPLGSHVVPIEPSIILKPEDKVLNIAVHDADQKNQRSLWGLTRSLVNNAVKGVSEGYTVELRLVGVGYRGAVEPIPQVFRDIQASLPRVLKPAKPGAPPAVLEPLPVDRLNLKLGFAHPIYIDIPQGIKVTFPQPTKIVLTGVNNQKLGAFAAKIRQFRKPEPYRGKVSWRLGRLTRRASLSATRLSSSRRSRRSNSLHGMYSYPQGVKPKPHAGIGYL